MPSCEDDEQKEHAMAAMTQGDRRVYIQTARAGCNRRRQREVCVTDAVNIDDLLRGEGYDTPDAMARARQAIEAAGLTHPGKHGIAAAKAGRVRDALTTTLLRASSDACIRIDRSGPGRAREAVRVTAPSCEISGGSNNRRGAIDMLRTLRRKHIERIVIVGGTPHLWREARQHFADAPEIEVRYVDGTDASH
jgi:hypothetical protein